MTVKIKYQFSEYKVIVRQVGSLEGGVNKFINDLHFAQAIDRASLRGRRIKYIGAGNE